MCRFTSNVEVLKGFTMLEVRDSGVFLIVWEDGCEKAQLCGLGDPLELVGNCSIQQEPAAM